MDYMLPLMARVDALESLLVNKDTAQEYMGLFNKYLLESQTKAEKKLHQMDGDDMLRKLLGGEG